MQKRSGWGWGTPCGGHGQSGAPGTVTPVRAVGSPARTVPLRSPRKLDVSTGAAGYTGYVAKGVPSLRKLSAKAREERRRP